MLSGQIDEPALPAAGDDEGLGKGEEQLISDDPPQRTTVRNGATRNTRVHNRTKDFKSYDGTDEDSAVPTSGEEWDGGDDDDADDQMIDDGDEEDLEMSDEEASVANDEAEDEGNNARRGSLVVSLRYQPRPSPRPPGKALLYGELPLTNGIPGPISAPSSDVQAPGPQQDFQKFIPQSDAYPLEAKPGSQNSEGSLKRGTSPIEKTSQAAEQPTYSRQLADAALA